MTEPSPSTKCSLSVYAPGAAGSVLVNGAPALSNLDVYAAAGGMGKALDESLPVTVPTGSNVVTVTFQAAIGSANTAMVSAIELIPAPSAP